MVYYKGWSITTTKNRNLAIASDSGDERILDKSKETYTNEELLEILKKVCGGRGK